MGLRNLQNLPFGHELKAEWRYLRNSPFNMNIGIDIRCLMDRELTGVGEYTNNLLKHLFEIDRENEYYLFYNSHRKVEVPRYEYGNVHYARFGWPNKVLNLCMVVFGWPRLDGMVKKKMRKCENEKMRNKSQEENNKIDLFFFPNAVFFRVKCPYIITCHDLSFEYFDEFLSLRRKLWHKIVNPIGQYERARGVVAVSENTKVDLLEKLGWVSKKRSTNNQISIINDKISMIYSGISENYKVLNKKDPKLKKIRQKYRLPEKFVFFLGTKEPRKNIDSLVRAFELFKNETGSEIKLVIGGAKGWKNTSSTSLASVAYGAKVANTSITSLPYIPERDKRYFYNLARMFVFPSHYEGFGFPVLEAMACGCPVIASNNSSLSEITGDSALLINSHDVNELKNAIVAMADKEMAEYFREKGLERMKKFRWEKTAEEFSKLIKSIK